MKSYRRVLRTHSTCYLSIFKSVEWRLFKSLKRSAILCLHAGIENCSILFCLALFVGRYGGQANLGLMPMS
jgi:hypothetical protein